MVGDLSLSLEFRVIVYRSGRVRVTGRLADKVRNLSGGTPYEHVGYVGLQWKVD